MFWHSKQSNPPTNSMLPDHFEKRRGLGLQIVASHLPNDYSAGRLGCNGLSSSSKSLE